MSDKLTITITGAPASGKTLLMARLANYLEAEGDMVEVACTEGTGFSAKDFKRRLAGPLKHHLKHGRNPVTVVLCEERAYDKVSELS